MEEPTLYKRDSMKNARIPYGLVFRRYWPGLLGISMSWFIYDFITYVNNPDIPDFTHILPDIQWALSSLRDALSLMVSVVRNLFIDNH